MFRQFKLLRVYLFIFVVYRYKDGVAISENSTCYETSGYQLIIKEVRQKDAGIFTISLLNQEKGLHRNLSYKLEVRGMEN